MPAVRIVVDAMGGDFAPRAAVDGAVAAAREFGLTAILVGREEDIRSELARLETSGVDVVVVHAPDVIPMDELAPAAAVRTTPDSSISRGMRLLRDGEADAFVTVGNTGAALAGAMFRLGRLHGVRRPALATRFPTIHQPCVMLDIGANTEVRPEYLVQFAVMGAAYAEHVLGVSCPRVGLVSNGEERGKGSEIVKEAVPLLEALKASGLNFIGNIEGRDIPLGNADVAVLDGFTGNVLLKFAEGAGSLVGRLLQEAVGRDPLAAVGVLFMRRSLQRMRQQMDYRAYGGALLLGVRGVVVIGHGRSDQEGVKAAVQAAVRAVEGQLIQSIASGIASCPGLARAPAP
jgi:glycerol-3-phosphate acyltransferase PlsX